MNNNDNQKWNNVNVKWKMKKKEMKKWNNDDNNNEENE